MPSFRSVSFLSLDLIAVIMVVGGGVNAVEDISFAIGVFPPLILVMVRDTGKVSKKRRKTTVINHKYLIIGSSNLTTSALKLIQREMKATDLTSK